MAHALIFVNGDINDGEMVQRALTDAESPFVIAVDGGARIAQHFKQPIDLLIGDMDSLTEDEFQAIADSGVEIQRHPPEKDFTDLELALITITERGYDWIRIIGGIGGRVDQTLANIYLLTLSELSDCDVQIVAGKQTMYLLRSGTHTLHGTKDDTISLLPIGGAVHGIHSTNLYYPLNEDTLDFGHARGISNVMTANTATLTIREGNLLVVHTIGRA